MAYLASVADATRPFQTGDTYVNFMELDDASAERVKAAYAPEDFERLVALKDRYDPHNVFRFNRNIRSLAKRVEEGLTLPQTCAGRRVARDLAARASQSGLAGAAEMLTSRRA